MEASSNRSPGFCSTHIGLIGFGRLGQMHTHKYHARLSEMNKEKNELYIFFLTYKEKVLGGTDLERGYGYVPQS